MSRSLRPTPEPSEGQAPSPSAIDRPPWYLRRFAFGHPHWMLADFVERLRGLIPRAAALTERLDEGLAHRQLEGKWSIAQNLGHLADAEVLWQARFEELSLGRDTYTPADPKRFQAAAERHQEQPLSAILGILADRRRALTDALAAAPLELQLASAHHARLDCRMRLVDCAQFYAEHDDHHLLRVRTLRQLLGRGAE